MDEWNLIGWLRQRVGTDRRLPVGIGDDCALFTGAAELLITTDMLLEGVHFDPRTTSWRSVGRKAMNVNISDIAAMAGRPLYATCAVALPKHVAGADIEALFEGLLEAAHRQDVLLVGGDTNASPGPLVISITVLGQPTGSGPVRRSGARAGDVLFVTGRLGYSLVGAHLDFTPRTKEAIILQAGYAPTAMIDLSDGLGSDLFHLCDESHVGAELVASVVPVRQFSGRPADDRSPLDHALNDGEDFELLFTVDQSSADRLERDQPFAADGVPVTRIGQMIADPGVWIWIEGERRPLPRGGYQHRWSQGGTKA